MKLSYDGLPSNIKYIMQTIAQNEILRAGEVSWNEFQTHVITNYGWDCLYILIELKTIQMMGDNICPVSTKEHSVIDWVSIMKLFNMYSAESSITLAPYVIGGSHD